MKTVQESVASQFTSEALVDAETTSTQTDVEDPEHCGGKVKQCITRNRNDVITYVWNNGTEVTPRESCGQYTNCTANALEDEACEEGNEPSD